MTSDELLKLPDEEHYELVDGKLVESGRGCLAGWILGVLPAHALERRIPSDFLRRDG